MFHIGAAIALVAVAMVPCEAWASGGSDLSLDAQMVAVSCGGPFLVVGAILFGIGLRRSPPR